MALYETKLLEAAKEGRICGMPSGVASVPQVKTCTQGTAELKWVLGRGEDVEKMVGFLFRVGWLGR